MKLDSDPPSLIRGALDQVLQHAHYVGAAAIAIEGADWGVGKDVGCVGEEVG